MSRQWSDGAYIFGTIGYRVPAADPARRMWWQRLRDAVTGPRVRTYTTPLSEVSQYQPAVTR